MNGFDDWMEGLTEGQLALQYELSCLADGELDEAAAAKLLVKLEADDESRAFFEDVQRFARLHRDVADPDRISARMAMLAGELTPSGGLESALNAAGLPDPAVQGLDRKLAKIFYQLGKAYVLSALDPDRFQDLVFAAAVPIRTTKDQGRGFVDQALQAEQLGDQAPRWAEARHLFNGRLERIEDPIQKGIKLLEQALEIENDHEEARIYLAFVHGYQGRTLMAERLYKEVFDSAVAPENRGHAAMQIGQLYTQEGDHKRAAHYYRWITLSGLAEQEPRFWPAYFNLGVASMGMGQRERGLRWFRELLDRHPEKTPKVAALCLESPTFKETVEANPAFASLLQQTCPELFQAHTPDADVL